jgi:hypothetical protein
MHGVQGLHTRAAGVRAARRTQSRTLGIILELAALLDEERVSHCQWKGAGAAGRWRSGGGDIDLLIEHAHANRFRSCAARLELELAVPADGPIPGIESYLGFDRESGRVVHFHVYYRLLVGTPTATLFALPLERALLETASTSDVFPVPQHDLELITVTLHRLLSERLPAALRRPGRGAPADVARLQKLVAPAAVAATLRRHIPELPHALFQRCVRALLAPHAIARRAWLRLQVRRALRAHAVAGTGAGWRQMIARRVRITAGTYTAAAERKRLATGGLIVALVGGDGSGKSTCAAALDAWLSGDLATRHLHLGHPRRSLLCLAAGALLRVVRALHRDPAHGDSAGARQIPVADILELVRDVAVARDRYRLYVRARRLARRGWVVLCERYTIPENRLLVGPGRSRAAADRAGIAPRWRGLADRLVERETLYYDRIAEPDVVAVLRVAPELAVRRKPQEPADYVRRRATIIWETDWSRTRAVVIDAALPLPVVVATLKETVWSRL